MGSVKDLIVLEEPGEVIVVDVVGGIVGCVFLDNPALYEVVAVYRLWKEDEV